jgi:RNA polymerase sigma-70 factor, ECF subfamily
MATRQLDPIFERVDSPASAPDRELTLSFQRGDKWAYDLIFRRYASRVQSVCRRMLSDPQDAQDAAQETFLRVYQALPRFNGEYQLGAWISRIATNVCLDYLRARKRAPFDSAPNEVLDDWADDPGEESPEDALMRTVDGLRVHETLASLSPLHRRAITMRDLEGRDYRDIASTLGVPEARARVLLHRARKGFKRSWSSAGIFLGLPLRLLQRVRRLRGPGIPEPLMEAAAPAAQAGHGLAASAPLAASCSQIAGSCGGVVSERIAAAATAALVGVGVTASGGASVALTKPHGRNVAVVAIPASSQRLTKGLASAVSTTLQSAANVAGGVTDLLPETDPDAPSDQTEASVGDTASGGDDATAADPAGTGTPATDDAAAADPVTVDPAAPDTATDPSAGTGAPAAEPSPTPTDEVPPDSAAAPGDSASPAPEETSTTDDAAPGEAALNDGGNGQVDGLPPTEPDAEAPAADATPAPEPSPTPTPTPTPTADAGSPAPEDATANPPS